MHRFFPRFVFASGLLMCCALGACVSVDDDDGGGGRRRRDAGAATDGGDGYIDGGMVDGGWVDGGWVDGGRVDSGQDAGWADGGREDGGDVGVDGGGTTDAGQADAGPADAGPLPDGTSIEFGRTLYGTDYAVRNDVPAGGSLFSVWSRVPSPGTASYPWVRGNMDVYVLYGPGWHLRCLGGNIIADSATSARYNANSMLFTGASGTWVDDYTYYINYDPMPASVTRDWVWLAWQVVIENDTFIMRQWLKFGVDGDVFLSAESTPTFDDVRDRLVSERGWSRAQADAWVPGLPSSFQVGKDNGFLIHARMDAMSGLPSLSQLEQIASSTTASGAAWADYGLSWHDGAPDLTDRSGHGRHLQLEAGGALHQGPAGPL